MIENLLRREALPGLLAGLLVLAIPIAPLTGDPLSWLFLMGILAVAAGMLWLVGTTLSTAPSAIQAICAAVVSCVLFKGATALSGQGHAIGACALAIGGCIASLIAMPPLASLLGLASPSTPVIGLPIALLWGAVASSTGSTLVALMAACAVAASLSDASRSAPGGAGKAGRIVGTGAILIGIGYALRAAGLPAWTVAIKPAWMVGLVCLLAGPAMDWRWRAWDDHARLVTVLLAAVSLGWGIASGEGTFVAAGGMALVAWLYAVLLEALPGTLSPGISVVVLGGLLLAVSRALAAHWAHVFALLHGGI